MHRVRMYGGKGVPVFKNIAMALFLVSNSVLAPARGAGRLGDRTLIELNATVYTQRQLETLALVQSILFGDSKHWPVAAANWAIVLDWYADHMMIDQEAMRTQGYNPNEEAIQGGLAKVESARKTDRAVLDDMKRLGLDDSTSKALRRSVLSALRAEAFARVRSRRTGTIAIDKGDRVAGNANGKGDTSGDAEDLTWLKDLHERAILRLFEGVRNFRIITPVAESH